MSQVPLLTEHDETLTFQDHYLRVRHLRHATSEAAGERPTLVFLHDSLGSIRLWRDFPAHLALALGCHALVYDRRGYGESAPFGPEPRTVAYLEQEALLVPAVLRAAGVSQAVLFGHSDGGTLALLTAAQEPGVVAAVVTVGAHVFVEDVTLAGIRVAQQQYSTTDLPQRLARYHGTRTEPLFRAWAETWLHPTFRNWNIERYLPQIQCPVLVMQGAEDEYGTAAQVEAIATQVAGTAHAVLLPGLGHTPHRQDPEQVLKLAVNFLRAVL
ncbi:alpha/beta fold hydrolase [Hymenobacter wooponensis]|uniref:Alpha/beta hydrolase n=1 Tax=Hymenobacter wooponensis TaxID=1525360 RepID=A0A4Z0MQP5_9BACT|nr:alpha/beta hydrolase [Hymenobacter wooponensis]TGD81556.1 alpha/beta hydrolase [Hymenobacter wooponensis]